MEELFVQRVKSPVLLFIDRLKESIRGFGVRFELLSLRLVKYQCFRRKNYLRHLRTEKSPDVIKVGE